MDWQWPSATPCQAVMNNPTILSKAMISWPSVYERMYLLEECPSTESDSSSCYSCSRSRSSDTGIHRFPKIWEPPHISTPLQSDMKQVPHQGNTNIRCHGTKCISPGDLKPRTCAPLFLDAKLHHRVMRRRRFETNIKYTRNAFLVIRRLKMVALRCVVTSGFVSTHWLSVISRKNGILGYRCEHLHNCYWSSTQLFCCIISRPACSSCNSPTPQYRRITSFFG